MTKYTKKWVCPRYMYNGKYYPNILSGSGYVMTRYVAKCLYKASLMLPYFHLEDVLVTGKKPIPCILALSRFTNTLTLQFKIYRLLQYSYRAEAFTSSNNITCKPLYHRQWIHHNRLLPKIFL